MKRLIRKAFGTTLYHGTSLESLKSITEMGVIMPQESEGGGLGINFEAEITKLVNERLEQESISKESEGYFDKYIEYYQEETKNLESQVMEGYTFFTDTIERAMTYTGSEPSVIIEVSISEDALLPDDNDCPDCKTWQESLQKVNQIKVSGQITSDYIVGVHLISTNGSKKVFYPKLTWIDKFEEEWG